MNELERSTCIKLLDEIDKIFDADMDITTKLQIIDLIEGSFNYTETNELED